MGTTCLPNTLGKAHIKSVKKKFKKNPDSKNLNLKFKRRV